MSPVQRCYMVGSHVLHADLNSPGECVIIGSGTYRDDLDDLGL
jgi:hypothetical protein